MSGAIPLLRSVTSWDGQGKLYLILNNFTFREQIVLFAVILGFRREVAENCSLPSNPSRRAQFLVPFGRQACVSFCSCFTRSVTRK